MLYEVDVAVDKDGAILECQCECAVGTGPDAHCKHMQCVLYGLVYFAAIHEVVTKETCTQQLDLPSLQAVQSITVSPERDRERQGSA